VATLVDQAFAFDQSDTDPVDNAAYQPIAIVETEKELSIDLPIVPPIPRPSPPVS
jgi:hypothetical protein